MENRQEILNIVSQERDYQEAETKKIERPDMIENFGMGDTLSAIQYNLDKARENWYIEAKPYPNTTSYLRKVAALCVKAGEAYGMTERK